MPRKKKHDASFGPRLAALRKARGLTQVQFAEATKTSQRSISCDENDNGVPPASRALRVSAGQLLGLKPPSTAAPALSDDDPETRRLAKRLHVVSQVPENDQRAAVRLINSLAALATPRKNGSQGARHGR